LPIYNNTEEIDANVDEGKDTKDLYYESEELGCKETIINFFHLDEDIIDGNNLRLWFETKYSKYVEEDDYRNDLQLLCGKFYELTDSRKLSNIKNTPAENKFKSSVRKVFRDLYEKGKLDKIVNINPIV